MGREAECTVRWGEEVALVRILLEGTELIVRGAIKRRIPFSAIQRVDVLDGDLLFDVENMPVALGLGEALAQSWKRAIQATPPSLAKKFGISAKGRVHAWGTIDAHELSSAIAEGTGATINLVLIRASTPLELECGLGDCWQQIESGKPVWIVYPKRKSSPLGEAAVREKMRGLGLMDTKVASVSGNLTGLRFIYRTTEE